MMMGLGFLWLLLLGGGLLVALFVGLELTSRRDGGIQWPSGPSQKAARQILDERFARGEISSDEYDEMRRELQAPSPSNS
ncbi:MAG TPA: hypothetical protein ENN19_17720 [Chloroflexi bacterium]|nr:hypothetical protein [Chloroflexota bacterium]